MNLTCAWCHVSLPAPSGKAPNNPRLYCSRVCNDKVRRARNPKPANRLRTFECRVCQAPVTVAITVPRQRSKYCSADCLGLATKIRAGQNGRIKTGPQTLNCVVCSKAFEFTVVTIVPKYCGQLCQSRGRSRLSTSTRRRLARREVERAEKVSPRAVFERDGFICHICRKPLAMTERAPSPLSPSIDHIVPISKGGKHTFANLRAAHLRCNMSRGNRAAAQLRIL